jgi:hypothetical protein
MAIKFIFLSLTGVPSTSGGASQAYRRTAEVFAEL